MPISIPVHVFQSQFNPLEVSPWDCGPISPKEIGKAIATANYHREAHPKELAPSSWTREQHIGRIAYLATNGWADPIEVDVGVPSLGCVVKWPICDGNHRLAAAIYRNDAAISASISGELDYARELFGVDCQDDDATS